MRFDAPIGSREVGAQQQAVALVDVSDLNPIVDQDASFEISSIDLPEQERSPINDLDDLFTAGLPKQQSPWDVVPLAASDLRVGGTLGSNVIPEPSAAVLAVIGLLLFCRIRYGVRSR